MSEPHSILKKGGGDSKGDKSINLSDSPDVTKDPNRKPLKRQGTAPPAEKSGEEKRKQVNSKKGGVVVKKKEDLVTSTPAPTTDSDATAVDPNDADDPEKCIIS